MTTHATFSILFDEAQPRWRAVRVSLTTTRHDDHGPRFPATPAGIEALNEYVTARFGTTAAEWAVEDALSEYQRATTEATQ